MNPKITTHPFRVDPASPAFLLSLRNQDLAAIHARIQECVDQVERDMNTYRRRAVEAENQGFVLSAQELRSAAGSAGRTLTFLQGSFSDILKKNRPEPGDD